MLWNEDGEISHPLPSGSWICLDFSTSYTSSNMSAKQAVSSFTVSRQSLVLRHIAPTDDLILTILSRIL